ncbi:hypothetical protein MY10362_002712 [Beauveria mimosiformis]
MAHPPRILHHGAGAKDVQFWLEGDASAGSHLAAKGATKKKAYDRTLQYLELLLMNCGSRDHLMYLPAEQMIRHAVRKPWINAAFIVAEGISTVGLDENSNVLLSLFSFGITPGLIKVPGRVLDCP